MVHFIIGLFTGVFLAALVIGLLVAARDREDERFIRNRMHSPFRGKDLL